MIITITSHAGSFYGSIVSVNHQDILFVYLAQRTRFFHRSISVSSLTRGPDSVASFGRKHSLVQGFLTFWCNLVSPYFCFRELSDMTLFSHHQSFGNQFFRRFFHTGSGFSNGFSNSIRSHFIRSIIPTHPSAVAQSRQNRLLALTGRHFVSGGFRTQHFQNILLREYSGFETILNLHNGFLLFRIIHEIFRHHYSVHETLGFKRSHTCGGKPSGFPNLRIVSTTPKITRSSFSSPTAPTSHHVIASAILRHTAQGSRLRHFINIVNAF